MPPLPSTPTDPISPSPPPMPAPTLSTLASALDPDPHSKYSTQARLYLSKYRSLHTLSQSLLATASRGLHAYLHHGCLCFIHTDLSSCHTLITQLDTLSSATHAHAHEIARQAFAASERLEVLRRRDRNLLEKRNQMSWELVARQCQVDAQVNRWNALIRDSLRERELGTARRVGLMMCQARLGLAEQAARKQERRNERVSRKLVASWEGVDRARRVAGFLAEYDECLQGLQGCVDFVAKGIEVKLRGMVERGEEVWKRKWGEHLEFQRVAGDTLECPSCLYERWSGPMEFGERVGWFRDDRTLWEERGEVVRGRERASSV